MEIFHDVSENIKKEDKWLMPYLAGMNPEKDYEKMISLFVQYNLDMFSLHFTVNAGTMYNIQRQEGGETLAFTNKVVRRPNRRNEDGLTFFWTWYAYGPSHPKVKASVSRLNEIHMQVAKVLPGNFSHNDDFLYTLCMNGVLQDRIFEDLGMPASPEFMKIAMHHELRDLAALFVSETGPVFDFPEDYDGMVRFVEAYDARDWGEASAAHRSVAEALIEDFARRRFPAPLYWLGRNMIKFAVREPILARYGVEPLTPQERDLTADVLRTMYAEQMAAPDRKTSFLLEWKPMENEDVLAADRAFAAVADVKGWVKGGQEALATTRA